MQTFEKLGTFYLGKIINTSTGKPGKDYLLFESKNLTTHAVCVGMTGSGKTGLGITILEEAALDKIPAIIIDPKGDLTNLLLTFPNLSPEEFKPWIDASEAERKGMSLEAYTDFIAKTWQDGLAAWGEDADRIKSFRNSVDLAVYTPASTAGIPISILSSFAAPTNEKNLDPSALRDKILSLTSSLLGLLGIDADPIKSREHILISTIIQQAWQKGINLDIASLIQQIQKPPFTKIGALDIDTFYPPKDRMALSISLNNLLASPGFQAWMEGQPLDIDQLLYAPSGKPKLSIISIAHLADSERMFFVTLLLNEYLSWMRQQSGTSNLRALLYMDEIFGFFPPTANPPSKLPMLTLLKQARAFGLGVVLCTQNPVDLDYKGLSNCGTWFIGKLQTERDKARVLEGLKVASNGELEANSLEKMLALTGKRIFIMRSIHEKDPILFETRWTLSYLRGPLTLNQIAAFKQTTETLPPTKASIPSYTASSTNKANVPPSITEYFVHPPNATAPVHYNPRLGGIAKIHFVDSKNKIDIWQDIYFAVPAEDDGNTVPWDTAKNFRDLKDYLQKAPVPGSSFATLPSGLMQEKNYSQFAKQLAISLYQNRSLTFYQSTNPNIISKEGESESDFRQRIALERHGNQDEHLKKIREKYAAKIATLNDRIERAKGRVQQKQQKAWTQKIQTVISFGSTILDAILGRKLTKGTISQTGTSLRRATQMSRDSQDATLAENEVANYQKQLQDLETQMNDEIAGLNPLGDDLHINTLTLRPRKSDITIEKIALVWWAL